MQSCSSDGVTSGTTSHELGTIREKRMAVTNFTYYAGIEIRLRAVRAVFDSRQGQEFSFYSP
jgi:hypothetical protein